MSQICFYLPRIFNFKVIQLKSNSTWIKMGITRVNFMTSINIPKEKNHKNNIVAAHMFHETFNINQIKDKLMKHKANFNYKDKFISVQSCKDVNHTNGNVVITNNGVIVFWGESNKSYESYKSILMDSIELDCSIYNCIFRLPEKELFSSFSETMNFKETDGETKVCDDEILLTNSHNKKLDEIAISLALMTAVKLNYLESDIKRNMEVRNKELLELRNGLKSQNLDKAAKILFDLETYAHDCRYRLNLQQDLLEYPDVLWDYDKQCDLFNRIQSTFELPKRLEHLNHRISWTLETLNSYSEYVRHKHSSRLEKIIIAVISVEMILGLIQTIRNTHYNVINTN